jgi:branched-chain amino acid transport system substrate-binding protein
MRCCIKSMPKRVSVITAAGTIAALLAACSSGAQSPSGTDKTSYPLGFSLTLSGAEALYGTTAEQGANIAISELNASGGVKGHHLKGYYVDNQYPDATAALAGLQQLISLDHVLSVTSLSSDLLAAYKPITSKANILLFNYAATDPTIADPAKLTYSLITNAPQEADALVKYVSAHHKIGDAATLVEQGAVGESSQIAFDNAWKAAGGTIGAQQSYPTNSLDYTGELAKLAAAKPAFVYLQGETTPEIQAILKAAKQTNFHPQWLSQTFFGASNASQPIGTIANNVIYSYVTFNSNTNALSRTFNSEYVAKYHTAPDIYSATSAVSVELMAAALKAAGTDPSAIQRFLSSVNDFDSILGPLSLHDGQASLPVQIFQIVNGTPKLLASVR